MSADAPRGGHAFPTELGFSSEAGMSLRDYFAARAMQALLGQCRLINVDLAADAYVVADLMIAEGTPAAGHSPTQTQHSVDIARARRYVNDAVFHSAANWIVQFMDNGMAEADIADALAVAKDIKRDREAKR